MDIGRRQNADPRWILPLLCRRGHITRNEIGAIRIGGNETHFQVPRAVAGKFAAALERTAADSEGADGVHIEAAAEGPREAARVNRKAYVKARPGAPQRPGPGKPHRKGPPRKDWSNHGPKKPRPA